jgi:prepilin-type N-terminal cleavage/methylation domain-containing protein
MKPTRTKFTRLAGYTLVELMVAAVLLGICVSGVMTMISVGRQAELDNSIRRQARIFAANQMESDQYNYTQYPATAGMASPPDTINRDTIPKIVPTISVTVSPESSAVWNQIGGGSISFQYQKVTVAVSWLKKNGNMESVGFQKIIAAIKPTP